ncbi:hypothetical protein EDC96DRAFT_497424 [Choanephora cucurbitarum]|nr:hypothetical protein EDC96DRAFT_497424 [Choanephora cucurbitarum]
MLRATTNNLIRNSQWKNQTVNCFRNYATSDDSKKQEPLSQRLGGTGRGRILEGATDPFAAFLANAKSTRQRNGNFTPRPRKQKQTNNDQFADAEETQKQPRQNKFNKQKKQDNDRRGPKKMNVRRSAPQEVRTRRATTFIDKDIDWSSFEGTQLNTVQVEQTDDDHQLVLKDMQGDYDRYLGVGTDIKWSDAIEGSAVNNLVGSNSTFDIQQKTAFLAAVSKATGGSQTIKK